jgi:regulator of protease activity HflC (stomatin/prohibitin superfamily)
MTYAVGAGAGRIQGLSACGSMEETFFCCGCGSFAATPTAKNRFFRPAGDDPGLDAVRLRKSCYVAEDEKALVQPVSNADCVSRTNEGGTMTVIVGIVFGFVAWFLMRYLVAGIYTVDQNERAVKTIFGRAERIGKSTLDDPFAEFLNPAERERYNYPQLRVIQPGGPYFKWPWERVYKVSIATQTMNMAYDPETPTANDNGTILDAVTKDQLDVGLNGQIRYRVSERNLYAYLFGVKKPIVHVMGYFISILRERIANFEAPAAKKAHSLDDATPPTELAQGTDVAAAVAGVSINDLRKNLRDLNEHMDRECLSSAARYGVVLDASLITEIDPPREVESALAAINTAHNQVSSDISLAQAAADQKMVQSKRAVEIETLRAQAEVEPLLALAEQLQDLKQSGNGVLQTYMRSVRLKLYEKASRIIAEVK